MMNSKSIDEVKDLAIETTERAIAERGWQVDQTPSPKLVTIGCVMTNQERKDWGLCAAVCAGLVQQLPNVRFWWHVDTLVRAWNIEALLADYALTPHVEITLPPMDDAELARRYRMCDLTILPSLGEGFGYPIFESVACGVPCVHGNYAGGANLMQTCCLRDWLVNPVWERLDTQHNCVRPVFSANDWIHAVLNFLDVSVHDPISQHVDHLSWDKLKFPWRRWLREGL